MRIFEMQVMRPKFTPVVASALLAATFSYPLAAQTTAPASPKHASKKTAHAATQSPVQTDQPPTAAGFWAQVGDDGKVNGWFYFEKHDGVYDGRLVKMFKQPGDTHHYSSVCDKCEGDEKDAPMMGLTIIKGMKRDGNKYEDGTILDPRDGTVYHAQMEVSPDNQKLSVRGYLGIPLLGQTQVWQRLPDDAMAPADIPPPSHGPEVSQQ